MDLSSDSLIPVENSERSSGVNVMDGLSWLILSWIAVGGFCYFILNKLSAATATPSAGATTATGTTTGKSPTTVAGTVETTSTAARYGIFLIQTITNCYCYYYYLKQNYIFPICYFLISNGFSTYILLHLQQM